MRNLKSVRRTPLARYRRDLLAVFLSLCTLFPANVLYALHEVDHRFTVEGRMCGDDGEGMEGVVVSVKEIRGDVSGKGKLTPMGSLVFILHLHNENKETPWLFSLGNLRQKGEWS